MDMRTNALPAEGYVRLPQILAVIPVSRSTWWQWVSEGKAPPGVKLSARCTAWPVAAIRDLLARLGHDA